MADEGVGRVEGQSVAGCVVVKRMFEGGQIGLLSQCGRRRRQDAVRGR
jgi:hypothetical protein